MGEITLGNKKRFIFKDIQTKPQKLKFQPNISIILTHETIFQFYNDQKKANKEKTIF